MQRLASYATRPRCTAVAAQLDDYIDVEYGRTSRGCALSEVGPTTSLNDVTPMSFSRQIFRIEVYFAMTLSSLP